MRAHLEIVAICDALIQPQKFVPSLVRIAHNPEALPGESPMKGISERRAKNRGVADRKSFTVVGSGLLGSIAREERGTRVAQILQVAAPKDEMPTVGGEAVIRTSDENIVVQASGSAENETGIVQTITGGKIVSHRPTRAEGLV